MSDTDLDEKGLLALAERMEQSALTEDDDGWRCELLLQGAAAIRAYKAAEGPVAWLGSNGLATTDKALADKWRDSFGLSITALYAAPQPSQSRDEVMAVRAIASSLREIVQSGMDKKPGYQTDREIYSQMHGQVLRLLEWDMSALSASPQREGWVLAPVEATDAMVAAFYRDWLGTEDDFRVVYRAMLAARPTPPVAAAPAREGPTHRHKKRGTEYVLLGIGKMQARYWFRVPFSHLEPVDMREVSIYRSADDGSLWVRPREEFEDGRFEALHTPSREG